MDIIIVSRRRGRTWRVSIDMRRLGQWCGAALVLALAGGAATIWGVGKFNARPTLSTAMMEQWSQEMEAQRQALAQAQADASAQAQALSRRIAMLQAQATRLDAAGERLIQAAGLDAGEFDFSSDPAVGGPLDETVLEQPVDLVADLGLALRTLADAELRLNDRSRQFRILEELMLSRRVQHEVFPSGWPARAGYVSSGYGYRTDPFTGRRSHHSGVDLAGARGSDIVASAAGIVTAVSVRNGYGKMVEINHGNGYVTRYAHARQIYVVPGERVMRGQPIAAMGSSGRSTGTHVHFEVLLNGKLVNPAAYLKEQAS